MTGDTWTHDNNWRVSNSCHWAEYSESGVRIAQGTHRLCAPTAEELARWDSTIGEIIARAERADLPSALYLRWGNLPRGGRSKNHATGELEAGVSVYGARYNPVTDLIEYAEDGTGCHAALTYLLSGAPCYLVTGTEVGRGSDGEPVLQDVRLLADLKPCEDGFEITLY